MTTILLNIAVSAAVCTLLAIAMWLPSRLPSDVAETVEFEAVADERLAA